MSRIPASRTAITVQPTAGCSKYLIPNTTATSLPVSERTLPKRTRNLICPIEQKAVQQEEEPFIDKTTVSYETLQNIIGNNGRWQLRVFLLAAFSGFCTSMHNFIYGFVGVVPDFKCAVPNLETNYTKDELWKQLGQGIDETERKCWQNKYNWNETMQTLTVFNNTLEQCTNFEFDQSEFESTIATEWNLVCKDATWAPLIQVTYMIGLLSGAPIFGAISDKFGRKTAILIATMIFSTAGPFIAFSPNFQVLLVMRFILAFALPGVYACSYVLAIEVISERWRSLAGNCFNLPFATGYTVLPIIAYFVRDWKPLQILCSLPSLFLFLTWCFLPESPRWLIRKGYLTKAESILRRAAAENGTTKAIPQDFSGIIKAIYEQEKESTKEASFWAAVKSGINEYLKLLKSPRMRSLFLTLCLCWFTIGMTYYGLGLNSQNLSTNRYIYTFIGGVLEFPAYLMVPPFIRFLGRKKVFIGFMITCAIALLISLFLPKGSFLIILLSYLGKLVIGANYSLVYLYSSELLPTLVRNCALGICSMMGRLGSTFAPFIVDIVGRDHHMYPSLIFGSLALFAGCVSLILPETQNRRLPETIEEIESTDDKSSASSNSD